MRIFPLLILSFAMLFSFDSCRTASESEATAEQGPEMPVPPPPPVEEPFDMKRVAGRTWVLQSIAAKPLPTEDVFSTMPWMEFNMEGGANGFAGCNSFNTSYTPTGAGKLEFGSVASTKIFCGGIVGDWESRFTGALAAVRGADLVGDQLYLLDPKGEHLLVFKAKR